MSNRTSIKYPGATTSISKVHINKMYIYTFHFAILLIHQILGAVPLPVTSPFAVEALSLRLRSRLGLLHLRSNFVLPLPFPNGVFSTSFISVVFFSRDGLTFFKVLWSHSFVKEAISFYLTPFLFRFSSGAILDLGTRSSHSGGVL